MRVSRYGLAGKQVRGARFKSTMQDTIREH